MMCWIYKGRAREETYLYLAGKDDTDPVPRQLLDRLGPLELVMELELHEARTLARANPAKVMRALAERGYYVQLPPVRATGHDRLM